MKLFQYAVTFLPNRQDVEAGKKPAVIVPVTEIIAEDEKSVLLQAAMKIPQEYRELLDRIEVAVRPF